MEMRMHGRTARATISSMRTGRSRLMLVDMTETSVFSSALCSPSTIARSSASVSFCSCTSLFTCRQPRPQPLSHRCKVNHVLVCQRLFLHLHQPVQLQAAGASAPKPNANWMLVTQRVPLQLRQLQHYDVQLGVEQHRL